MIVLTSIFVAEATNPEPLTFEQLEKERVNEDAEEARELIGLYEGKNRVLPIE